MKNKIIFVFMFVFLIGIIASQTSLGTLTDLGIFKQNEGVRITQICSDATYINISSITSPNSTVLDSNIEMVPSGNGEFYYLFNQTSQTGRYDVRGISDGCSNTFATYFEISLNGKAPAEGIIVVVYTLIFILIIAFGLVYFFVSLDHVIKFEMDLIDTVTMISTYLAMWVFYYVSYEYLGNALINDLLERAIDVGGITHMFLPLVGFMVSFIMTNLKFKQKARITY